MSDQDQDLLHTWVAKLLFLSKRAIPLYESARNRLGWLQEAPLGCSVPLDDETPWTNAWSQRFIYHWVLGWCGIHATPGHVNTGQIMRLGYSALYWSSRKQKINTQSWTKAERNVTDPMDKVLYWDSGIQCCFTSLYTRTTRAVYCWRIMGEDHAAKEHASSTYAISLSQARFLKEKRSAIMPNWANMGGLHD